MNKKIYEKLEQIMGRPNEKKIIRYILTNSKVSRTEISKALSISMSTVTNATEKLIKKDLIHECGLQKTERGRSLILLQVNKKKFKSIGIGITTQKIVIELVDLEGTIYAKSNIKLVESTWEDNLDNIKEALDKLLKKSQEHVSDIIGIGLATPGFVEYNKKNIDRDDFFNDEWHPKEIIQYIESCFGYGVNIFSTSSSILSGESYFGKAQEYNSIIYINISSGGIGWARMEGKILDKHLSKNPLTFGHTTIHLNGPVCSCSQHGCLELYTCRNALIQNYLKLASFEDETHLLNKNSSPTITYHEVLESAEKGDYIAVQAISKAATILGLALGNLIPMIHPDLIILGGKIIDESKLYFDIVKKTANDKLRITLGREFTILEADINRSHLGSAAASLVFENIFLV